MTDRIPPIGSRIIFNIALGPKQVLITSATVYPRQLYRLAGVQLTDLGSYDIGGLSFPSGLTLWPHVLLSAFAMDNGTGSLLMTIIGI
jgi:hypothetical protein